MEVVANPALIARPALGRDEKFFFVSAIVMAVIVVAGFGLNLAMGRSSFGSPLRVHVHAFVFFGWVVLYLVQNSLAATGSLALHRRLGWLAAVWMPAMVAAGIYVTAANVRVGKLPPFFQPAEFLTMNPLHILIFGGFVCAAILLRRRTQWHRRLMFIAMALLTAPAFGRLMPMPMFVPNTVWAVGLAPLVFPVAGVIRDLRKDGKVHPAWWWGIGLMLSLPILVPLIAHGAPGRALYEAVTNGSATALPPYEFPILQGR